MFEHRAESSPGIPILGGFVTYLDYFKSVLSWHYFVEAGEIFQAASADPFKGGGG